MVKRLIKILHVSISGVLIVQLIGCGTIFYPERRGQKAGNLDVGVVILDAIGLLFFIIPGVIAFAVDFSNGTIYLPAKTEANPRTQLRQIKFDPKHTSLAQIEKIIKDETGRSIQLTQDNMQVSRLNSQEDMMASFAQALPDIQASRFAYAHGKVEVHD